jgi:ligand-binding sensor domain-containing protein
MVTDGHFVVRYDPASRTSRRLGPFRDGPFDLRTDTSGKLWIADSGSVAVAATRSPMQVLERIRPPATTENTVFTRTLEDSHGDLWFGSFSGLFRRSGEKWLHYDTSNSLRSNRIVDLTLSPEGDLWVTYAEPKGTDRVHVVGERVEVENFGRSNGLTSDRVNSVAFDRQGRLWVLNDNGVEVRQNNRWLQYSGPTG